MMCNCSAGPGGMTGVDSGKADGKSSPAPAAQDQDFQRPTEQEISIGKNLASKLSACSKEQLANIISEHGHLPGVAIAHYILQVARKGGGIA